MKKNLKINIFILIIISFIVIFFSIKDNFYSVLGYLKSMNFFWLILCFLLMILNFIFQSLSLYKFIRKVKPEYKFKKVLTIYLSGLFFNGITPSSTGGQPFQLYMLKKDGIRYSDSGNILIQNFFTYQLSIVLIGTISIILNSIFNIFPQENLLKKAVFIGYFINLSVLLVLLSLSCAKKFNTTIFNKIINVIFKFKFIKNKKEKREKLNETLNNFYNGAVNLKKNKKLFILSFIFNTISVILLYTIPLFIFYALNDFKSVNLLEAIVSSGYTYLIGSFVPIPGGSGGLEYSFIDFFKTFKTGGFLAACMLAWRFITYYFGMILGAGSLFLYKKEEEK